MTTATTTAKHLEFQVRADTTGDRTITGIAVPWNEPFNLGKFYREQFAPGACEPAENGVHLFYRHDEVIGKLTAWRDTDTGWEITARISETTRGDEVYTMLKDGTLDRLSVGFRFIETTETEEEDGPITVTVNRAEVFEVSVVPRPAYNAAAVTAVRSDPPKDTEMPENTLTREDFQALEVAIADQAREFQAALEQISGTTQEANDTFRSYGDYVKHLAAGDEKAAEVYAAAAQRAYTGGTTADAILKDGWVGDLTRILGGQQPIKNLFSTGGLPAEGNNVEYAVLKSDSTDVTKQATEGADLAFGKVAIELKTAPIGTYGGYSSLSRQQIERSSVGVLDTTFTALAKKYAKAIETLARTTITTAFTATAANALPSVALPTTGDDDIKWLTALIDVAEKFDDAERNFEGLLVSKDVFLTLAAIEAKDRFLQVSGGPAGSPSAGTLSIPLISGSLAQIPIRVFPGWTSGRVLAYDSFALRTLESGGPLQLQDENVVNLTKDYSVYGYAASFVQDRSALVKITTGA